MSEKIDCLIVGAGVIGLAIARELALAGREVIVVEAQSKIGMGTSSRNSEVIHAGIYYPEKSLKAQLCVEGKGLLYRYCQEHSIPHSRLGKLIVATEERQIMTLQHLKVAAQVNGVNDLIFMEKEAVKKLEPLVHCVLALYSPSTGIVDSHSLMQAFQHEAEQKGGTVSFYTQVVRAKSITGGFEVFLQDHSQTEFSLHCRTLINSAGLYAQSLASSFIQMPSGKIPQLFLSKGNYFSMNGKSPFRHLIYPVPDQASLGVHATLDLAGQVRFGPDHEPLYELSGPDAIPYEVDPKRSEPFYKAILPYFPHLKEGSLIPSYSGVRPQLYRKGEPVADFCIQGPKDHGIEGWVNLFGIESPGLTCSMAIGRYVKELLFS